MGDTIRITIVGLLPESISAKEIPGILGQTVADEDPSVIHAIYRTAELNSHRQRTYVKISKLVDADELRDGWQLTVTERLKDFGCADVAWRVTEIMPGDTDSENTTASFPVELFQGSLESDTDEVLLSKPPPEPFGSDAFWKRFDDNIF